MGSSARQRGGRISYADERRAARRAEVAALCSLVVVLLWGACLIPLPAGKASLHTSGPSTSCPSRSSHAILESSCCMCVKTP